MRWLIAGGGGLKDQSKQTNMGITLVSALPNSQSSGFPMTQNYDDKRNYMREYMRDYRLGKRRKKNVAEIHEKMRADRLRGDDIYTIGLRYGYNPVYICRLFSHLPIKKHANRHKLFWSSFRR